MHLSNIMAALYHIEYGDNRPTLMASNVSNKFTLSDICRVNLRRGPSVVLVSWVDSAKIPPLVEEISI